MRHLSAAAIDAIEEALPQIVALANVAGVSSPTPTLSWRRPNGTGS